jgi:hypothetical protein
MLELVIKIAIAGLIVYAIITYVPMPQLFKTAILIISLILLLFYLMQVFGISDIPIPRFRRS